MLLELHIRNFALIDSLDIEFYEGLNILTGETGAGKSIVIDSVGYILGEKQSKDIIRGGQSSAFAEAVFTLQGNRSAIRLLVANGILEEEEQNNEDTLLIISREINKNGRSVSRINGRTVTVGVLKELGSCLLDIHGQHEHQSLLDESTHIEILDFFCKGDFPNSKAKYRELFQRLKEIDREFDRSRTDEQSKLRRIDLLKFQINEIRETKLMEKEEDELKQRREILVNSEKIYSSLNSSFQLLHENEGCAFDNIGSGVTLLDNIQRYDDNIRDINDMLKDVYFKLEDLTGRIRVYRDEIEFDQDELDEIETRLDLIGKLKRKYGNSVVEVLAYCGSCEKELESLEQNEEKLEKLSLEREKLWTTLNKLTTEMTKVRTQTANRLKELIEQELKFLGMEKAIFQIQINELDTLDENGTNTVRFLISANPGELPKPLAKIASGGEMSRIMLAVKNVIADIDQIPTLIFDEIDTGISGRTAQAVAEKMGQISKRHQLLCVTHLPQIAAMADSHFRIEKLINVQEERTTTNVRLLDRQGQIEELARMLGGAEVTAITREHSDEMLKLADLLKQTTK